ncbi:MAG: GIY-YIG nuclease family protein [Burkholderiales bacterium]
MFIKNFGLFWRADEVDWNPGKGARGAFSLLGRIGANQPGIRLANFRYQHGIYILYGNHGPHYVGLTKKQGLGKRLKDHLTDGHAGHWDRFSWFGFCSVLTSQDHVGLCKLKNMAVNVVGNPSAVITDVEALLIRAMGLRNINQTKFTAAEEWTQVKAHETKHYMDKVG